MNQYYEGQQAYREGLCWDQRRNIEWRRGWLDALYKAEAAVRLRLRETICDAVEVLGHEATCAVFEEMMQVSCIMEEPDAHTL